MVSCQISQNTRCIDRSVSGMITDMLAKYLSFSSTGGIGEYYQLDPITDMLYITAFSTVQFVLMCWSNAMLWNGIFLLETGDISQVPIDRSE
jgi:hypothetical protein